MLRALVIRLFRGDKDCVLYSRGNPDREELLEDFAKIERQ